MAYNQDPYPNQSTIEGLANELNVGVKTVINWFHNHRMRAKQQQHQGNTPGTTTGSNFDDFSENIKSEPMDDNSDQSDISSMSGEGNSYHPGFQGNESSSQWLFPQFEPVNSRLRRPEDGVKEENRDDIEDDRMSDVQSPLSFKTSSVDGEGKDGREEEESGENGTFHKQAALQNIPQTGVNKRKRSNPQYVSEGRQLDKTKTTPGYTTCLQTSVSRDEGVEVSEESDEDDDLEKENEDVNNHDPSLTVKPRFERCTKIDKLQKAIESPDDDWDEFDRSTSIEKLQNNLQHSPGGGWEF